VSAKLTLALVGDKGRAFEQIAESEWNRPWAEREKVDLEVGDDETLADVIDRALGAFAVTLPEHVTRGYFLVDLAFLEEDEVRPRLRPLALVDQNGLAIWNVYDYRLIPYREIARAADAGALAGDPDQAYLILKERAGNGVIATWPDVFEGLSVAWEVAKAMAVVGGAAAFVEILQRRLKRGRDVLTQIAYRWDQRGAAPRTFVAFLSDRRWTSEGLADLLGCTQPEAEAVLGVFGFTSVEGGDWQPKGDEAARLIQLIHEEIAFGLHEDAGEAAREEFGLRVREIMQTGSRPPPPEYDQAIEFESWEEVERRRKVMGSLFVAGTAAVSFLAGLHARRIRRH
jgi:hypothetical protein